MVGKARQGLRQGGSSRKLVKQVSVHIQEAGQKSRKWGETINPQSPPLMTYFLQQYFTSYGSLTSPNSGTNGVPSV